MAHTFGNNSSRGSSASSPNTIAFTPAAGSTALWLGIVYDGTTARTGGAPTFLGLTLTQGSTNQQAAASPETTVESWYLENPPILAGTVTIPNTGTLTLRTVVATAIAATGFTSKFDLAAAATGTSTNPSVSITTTVNGAAIFAVVGSGAQTWAPSARSGTQLFDTDFGNTGDGFQYLLQPTAGAQAMSWTFGTSEDWAAIAVAFKEVAIPLLACQAPAVSITAQAVTRLKSGLTTAFLSAAVAGAFFAPVRSPAIGAAADAVTAGSADIVRAPAVVQYQAVSAPVYVPNPDATAALTGVFGTGGVGTLGVSSSAAASGNAGTGSAGSFGATSEAPLSTVLGTGSVGSLGVAAGVAVSGTAATAGLGSVVPDSAVPVSGVAGTGVVGSVSSPGTPADAEADGSCGVAFAPRVVQYQAVAAPVYIPIANVTAALTGVFATGDVGTVGVASSVAPTGVAGTGAVGSVSAPTTSADAVADGSCGVLFAPRQTQYAAVAAPVYVPAAAVPALTWLQPPSQPVRAGRPLAPYVWGQQHFAVITEVVALSWTAIYPDAVVREPAWPTSIVVTPPRVSTTGTDALTGVAGTGAAGTVGVTHDQSVTGNAGTGAVGSVGVNIAVALTGVGATGAVGSVSAGGDVAVALTGVSATGSVGTPQPVMTVAVTGVAGTGAIGSMTVTVALTGVTATGAVGTLTSSGGTPFTPLYRATRSRYRYGSRTS